MEDYIYEQYKPYLENVKEEMHQAYIKERLIDQIRWYDKTAVKKQNRYKILMGVSIILTALIPIISIYTGFKYGIVASTAIALFSAAATAITAIVNLCEYQKLWIEYRNNCEILKSLLHRYFTGTGEFADKNEKQKFKILVELSESYLMREFQTWADLPHSISSM